MSESKIFVPILIDRGRYPILVPTTNKMWRHAWVKNYEFYVFRKKDGQDAYEYKGGYWEARKNPGFSRISLPKLW